MPEDSRGPRSTGDPTAIRTGGKVGETEKGAPTTAGGTVIRKAPWYGEDNVMLDQ
jgi:hypothetical protein